ncbi:MAG: methylated-DNA--[protein]-cysteine S-methyltransferase [Hyphomicrobiaceae bacterium]
MGPPPAVDDYLQIREAIGWLTAHWQSQPDLAALAAHLGLGATQTQKLFTRWCGLSPKEFVQAITIDHARDLLDGDASLLDAALEVGLSGPSRLHDLFVDHEAMSPGEYKRRGEGLTISWGFHDSPFGRALVMATARGICGIAFADGPGDEPAALADMQARWPAARYVEAPAVTASEAARLFRPLDWQEEDPIRVVMIGSDFEVRVWEELLRIPMGATASYGAVAEAIGRPQAARAVGAAVGRNPLSFVVPCHRVVGSTGRLTGYHWGITRKQAIIGWEKGCLRRLAEKAV